MPATILQVCGALLLIAAGWLINTVLGVALAGMACLAFGLALELGGK